MKLSELRNLIPFYAARTLDRKERKEVEQALAASPELKEDLKFWHGIRSAVTAHRRYLATGHPTSEQIVDFVEQRMTDIQARLALELHFAHCAECRRETEIIRVVSHRPHSVKGEKGVPLSRLTNLSAALTFAKKLRLAYVIPLLILITLVLVLYSPTPPPTSSEKYLAFALAYMMEVRDPSRQTDIPTLKIPDGITHIDLKITIPKSGIDSVLYSISLIHPSRTMTKAVDTILAIPHNQQLDLLEASFGQDLFTVEKKPYQILVSEILPIKHHDLTPEEYRYFFFVSGSLSKLRDQ